MTATLGPGPAGANSQLNITAATVVKAAPGVLLSVSVIVAGSAAGGAYDTTTTGGAAAATQIGTIPNTVGLIQFSWNCLNGIVIVPPTGGTVAVSFV